MSENSQVIIAVIGSQIAGSALMLTVIGIVWKSLNQRLDDVSKRFDERFKGLENLIDAKIETVRVEIRQVKEQIAKPPLVRP
jgi:hypothetical protein